MWNRHANRVKHRYANHVIAHVNLRMNSADDEIAQRGDQSKLGGQAGSALEQKRILAKTPIWTTSNSREYMYMMLIGFARILVCQSLIFNR